MMMMAHADMVMDIMNSMVADMDVDMVMTDGNQAQIIKKPS